MRVEFGIIHLACIQTAIIAHNMLSFPDFGLRKLPNSVQPDRENDLWCSCWFPCWNDMGMDLQTVLLLLDDFHAYDVGGDIVKG